MTITSAYYFIFILLGALVYYIVPKRARWLVLLVLSLVFYWFAGVRQTFAYIVFSAAVIYAVGRLVASERFAGQKTRQRAILAAGIVLCVLPWLLTAGSGLWLPVLSKLSVVSEAKNLPLAGALGMGYYTSMTISYMVDCYWGIVTPQKDPLKMLLYVSFFPQLTTGPISRYERMQSLYEGHPLAYRNIAFGAQRILWGVMKKLILAERLAVIVTGIWGDLDAWNGLWHWYVLLIYPIYMYADFSGCMDICIGTAEIFGISLPENFNNPFFARNIAEFWRRWHITLGQWAKDYVMYPVLKSAPFVRMQKNLKKSIGKQAAKFIVTAIASGFVWLVMGVWHGALKYIVGVSLFYWVMLELGELFAPLVQRLNDRFHIDKNSFGRHFFQSAKVYIIYAFGAAFFAAPGIGEAFRFIGSLFSMFTRGQANPWIIFGDDILGLGVTWVDINIILAMVLLLMIVGALRERHGYARNWVAGQSVAFRWVIWWSLLLVLLIWGKYGTGYDPAAFIYQVF